MRASTRSASPLMGWRASETAARLSPPCPLRYPTRRAGSLPRPCRCSQTPARWPSSRILLPPARSPSASPRFCHSSVSAMRTADWRTGGSAERLCLHRGAGSGSVERPDRPSYRGRIPVGVVTDHLFRVMHRRGMTAKVHGCPRDFRLLRSGRKSLSITNTPSTLSMPRTPSTHPMATPVETD